MPLSRISPVVTASQLDLSTLTIGRSAPKGYCQTMIAFFDSHIVIDYLNDLP